MSVVECFFIFAILIHFSLYYCQPLNYTLTNYTLTNTTFNISNMTFNNTFIPFTTTEFETSFSYYTTAPLPNDTSTIDVILHFQYDNHSIYVDNILLTKLTQIFNSVLNKTLIQNQERNLEETVYLQPMSDINNTNITAINLYLQWMIIILIENDTDIITILSQYLSSIQFIDDFNLHLDGNITLIKTHKLEIHETEEISTTEFIVWNTTTIHKDEYTISEHLRRFMLLYVVLFCIISISLLCFGFWFCTVKCFGNERADSVHEGDNDKEKDRVNQIETKPSCNDLYLNTSRVDDKVRHKYDEIDKNDREYMMKAFDDDEALHQNWYKEDSENSDEIQLIQSVRPNDSLTLTQRLKVQTAFDED